jgi:hypothetical protein
MRWRASWRSCRFWRRSSRPERRRHAALEASAQQPAESAPSCPGISLAARLSWLASSLVARIFLSPVILSTRVATSRARFKSRSASDTHSAGDCRAISNAADPILPEANYQKFHVPTLPAFSSTPLYSSVTARRPRPCLFTAGRDRAGISIAVAKAPTIPVPPERRAETFALL